MRNRRGVRRIKKKKRRNEMRREKRMELQNRVR